VTPVAAAGVLRVRVKVCGVTRPDDARLIEALGADAIGVIFAVGSRRRVDLEQAADVVAPLGPFVARVGVFVEPAVREVEDALDRLRLHAVQLHGEVDPRVVAALFGRAALVRAVSWAPTLDVGALARSAADALLIDGPRAGSGEPFALERADALRALPRWVLAGGLDPENVELAIDRLRPYAVDVASGVESAPGIKDPGRLAAFMAAVRRSEGRAGPRPPSS
jgi:phosphoribosylanthranilate isomerase